VVKQQLRAETFRHLHASFQQPPALGIGAIKHRIERGQVVASVDRRGTRDARREGGGQRTARPEILALRHQRAEAILAQDRRIRGQRQDDRSGAEEVGRIVTDRDAALEIDPPNVEPDRPRRLPACERFAQLVEHVLMARKRQVVGGAKRPL
jgi:hypothetical protein